MQTTRDKIIFYGVVPILAAVVGAVVTVIVSNMTGAASVDESVRIILSDRSLNAAQKTDMIKLVYSQDDDFWSFLRTFLMLSIVPVMWIVSDLGARLRNRP